MKNDEVSERLEDAIFFANELEKMVFEKDIVPSTLGYNVGRLMGSLKEALKLSNKTKK